MTDKAYQEMQAERTYLISRIDELEELVETKRDVEFLLRLALERNTILGELVETLSEKLAECAEKLAKCSERDQCK